MIIQLGTEQKANIHLLHETAGGNASSMTKQKVAENVIQIS
jgi:hypothetical protein